MSIDPWLPQRGPCAFCGLYDQRHRIAEAIRDRITAGEDAATVLGDYGFPLEAKEAFTAYDVEVDAA